MARHAPTPDATERVPEDCRHPWAAPAGRFPQDDRLREHLFTIASRRKGQEARWCRGGELWTETLALQECKRLEKMIAVEGQY